MYVFDMIVNTNCPISGEAVLPHGFQRVPLYGHKAIDSRGLGWRTSNLKQRQGQEISGDGILGQDAPLCKVFCAVQSNVTSVLQLMRTHISLQELC